jgi:lysophospholipase L1-like esterase
MRFRNILANVVLIAVSIGLGLALGEIATRLLAPQRMSGSWSLVGPSGAFINKSSGTAVHVLPTRTVTYEFNSKHLRNREEPNPQAVRVLVLGDSFTFGSGLALGNTYIGLLQRDFDSKFGEGRIQLLNAGAGGTGTADQLAFLEAFGDDLKPSAVVVFVSGDDFNRAIQRGIYTISGDTNDLVKHDRTQERSLLKRVIQGSALYNFLLTNSHLLQLVRNAVVFGGGGTVNTATVSEGDGSVRLALERRLATLLFRRMAAWCEARDIQFSVLTTGWPWGGYPWLGEVLHKDGIYFRDLRSQVAGKVDGALEKYQIKDDGHPNESGAMIIKDAAWPVLEKRLSALLRN